MKISCVFSKMQELGHFPIISSLIDRLIFYQLVFFMFTSLVFICVGFSVIGSSVAGFTVTGFSDDGLDNSGSFLKRSEFVFVVLLTPFSAWNMKQQGGCFPRRNVRENNVQILWKAFFCMIFSILML